MPGYIYPAGYGNNSLMRMILLRANYFIRIGYIQRRTGYQPVILYHQLMMMELFIYQDEL
jgi:hypothetical protein